MKELKNLCILFACALIVISCNKQSGNNAVGGVTTGTMSAKIEGTVWNSGPAIQAIKSGNNLTLSGSGSGAQIKLEIKNYTGNGTYYFSNNYPGNSATYTITSANPSIYYVANAFFGQGSLTVTSDLSGTIEGSFEFNGFNEGSLTEKAITEGAFKIKYN
jgi:hypothetical protein